MRSANTFQCGNTKANQSRRHKGNSSLRVVTNPTNFNAMQFGMLVPLPIDAQICCPENAVNTLSEQKVKRVVKVKSPLIGNTYQFVPTDCGLANNAITSRELVQPPHCPLGLIATQFSRRDKTAKRPSDFQSPVEWQSDPIFTRNNVSVKLSCFPRKEQVFAFNFHPQNAYRCISHCPNSGVSNHFSSSLHHQRMASRILSNSSSKLPSTLLNAFSISRRSRSNSLALFRLSFSHCLNAFRVSGHSTTGISFPSTTIVPTIFGLLCASAFLPFVFASFHCLNFATCPIQLSVKVKLHGGTRGIPVCG
jgi:hypothetical protein